MKHLMLVKNKGKQRNDLKGDSGVCDGHLCVVSPAAHVLAELGLHAFQDEREKEECQQP